MQAPIVELVREQVIPRPIIERVMKSFEQRAQLEAERPRAARLETLARIALSIQQAAGYPPNSSFRASQRRQEMHIVPEPPSENDN